MSMQEWRFDLLGFTVFDDKITTKWRQEAAASGRGVSPKMMDWLIEELRWKAGYLTRTGMIMPLDSGVVLSDTAISSELQHELHKAVAPLETLKKDFHPNSGEKVVDLVHPSLFPVIYGRIRVLRKRLLGLDDCLNHAGEGELLPAEPDGTGYSSGFSKRFQWMPCNIEFTSDGGCQIISLTIPLWNVTLFNNDNQNHRIDYGEVEYDPPDGSPYDEWERVRRIVKPEPKVFDPSIITPIETVNLCKNFSHGLQIIIKLANIELTLGKPEYEGGSWHIEGAVNEHICASALYYYSNTNTTNSSLSFRQHACERDINDMPYEQYNFSLADRSKPGHRKILALFLVDPHFRIDSSANVPPQREHWQDEKQKTISQPLSRLPQELWDMVMQYADIDYITLEEACQYRLELMEERTAKTIMANKAFETGDFNLCEH
ncbi:DUF4246 domain-containing protein [Aspergillus undulatus]|uniref:DUF4246 domain-containing protein n=1 Tax=Aspergillus undulatus TaxID=1810928 RepID=UPI003CCCCF1D